jgi:stage V sporulation protein AD
VLGFAAVAGKKESEGPYGKYYDQCHTDTTLGEASWEKAESRLQNEAVHLALNKAGLKSSDIDCIFAGDLLNQCISSTFGLRSLDIPFLGQYGACSTMAQTLAVASLFVESGAAVRAAAVTSSHFCSAERQFRFPLEYGGQRTPTAQWTATAAGSIILGARSQYPAASVGLQAITFGRIVDYDIKDAANMGAAMAPAAANTLTDYFNDTGTNPQDYDLVLTGDLGLVGSDLLDDLNAARGQRHPSGAQRLRPDDLRPRKAGCPRGRLRMRMQRGNPLFRDPSANEHRPAAQSPVYRHRRADVPHLFPAGRKHPRRRPPCLPEILSGVPPLPHPHRSDQRPKSRSLRRAGEPETAPGIRG